MRNEWLNMITIAKENILFDSKPSHDYNHFHNILRLFDVLPNVPFTTSKMMVYTSYITYKRGIYELPHKLPNDLRPWILGN